MDGLSIHRGLVVNNKKPQKQLKCEEIATPLHFCLIRARAHSAGAFIDYPYMQEQEKKREY
jgi:hypothetical protein